MDLSEGYEGFARRHREGLYGAISAGFFLLLIGVIFVITPNLSDRIIDFFNDLATVPVPRTGISLIAPAHIGSHSVLYMAAEQFCFALGLFQIVILALRFIARSPLRKKAETISNLIFWLGAGFLIRMSINEMSGVFNETILRRTWFAFWAEVIMLVGFSLIIRAIVLATASTRRVT